MVLIATEYKQAVADIFLQKNMQVSTDIITGKHNFQLPKNLAIETATAISHIQNFYYYKLLILFCL